MSNNPEDTDLLIDEDNTLVESDSIIENQENTADIAIIERPSQKELIKRKLETIIDNFKIGKTEEFKNMMIDLFNSMLNMNLRISELESQLEDIRNQFYRNELSDEDFKELLLLDKEE